MKAAWADRLFHSLNYAALTLFTLICVYPFYYILIYSISDPAEAMRGLSLWPRGLTFDNYRQLFEQKDIGQAFFISLSRTVAGTALTVFCCALFSYTVTKADLPWRKGVYRFLVITLYFNAGLIPWYLTMKWLGLKNNFLLYILPFAIVGFYVILMKTYIEQLPAALEESAMIDGAGYMALFWKIVFPLMMPIAATVAVFSAVNQWNTWTDNYFLVEERKLRTLQLLLYDVLRQAETLARRLMENSSSTSLTGAAASPMTPVSIKMTMTMITTLPILFVYPFLQRYFVKGIMLGAVKG